MSVTQVSRSLRGRSEACATSISVVVPTYRRSRDLERCLSALAQQIYRPDQIIVVYRPQDTETYALLERMDQGTLPLVLVNPAVAGVVSAYNSGLDAARGDVIAFTDDDATPHREWLERIVAHFESDTALGGLGGRDRIYVDRQLIVGANSVVGKVQWFGRTIGNHHLGFGPPREVDILKGVNMSFRNAAIGDMRFDTRFLGSGAQVDCEMAFSFTLKRRGWKLVYDPDVLVDHHIAPRHDVDQRNRFSAEAMSNQAHNETLALLDYLPRLHRFIFLVWAVLVGTRAVPGLAQLPRLRLLGLDHAGRRVLAALRGRWAGSCTWLARR